MKIWILLVLVLGLNGCATTANYDAKLATYVGATEEQLVANWGIPNKTYDLPNGKKAVEFVNRSVVEVGGFTSVTPYTTYQTGTINGQEFRGTSTSYMIEKDPPRKQRLSCTTTFLLDKDGKVESFSRKGNNCVAYK